MVNDDALKEMVAVQLLGSSTSATASDSVFKSFQRLADYTKDWLRTDQLERAKKCFALINSFYGRCSIRSQMAIENVFMFSVICCIDGLPNRLQIHDLLPYPLKQLALRCVHDI
jgi:hypothetical protein